MIGLGPKLAASWNIGTMRTIEEEIKQKKPFKNDYQRAAVNLIYTGKWVVQLHSEIFKEFNLTLQQYNTLRILKGSYPKAVTAKYIRMRMLDKTSDVSRIVETMFKNGLINQLYLFQVFLTAK